MKVEEKKCKSIISDSALYGVDYSINPYTGCEHGCEYCFATYMKKYSGHSEPWGEFVEVKVNARKVLEDDLMEKDKGSILISAVTDPYQPVEEEYEITRSILERLADTEFPVTVLTKSDLILRDLDLLGDFSPDRISVGFTINFLNEKHRSLWEPESTGIEDRIEALEKISEEGIDTYAHIGPYLPGITDLEKILDRLESYIVELQVENLSMGDNEGRILEVVRDHYPDLEEVYEGIRRNPERHALQLRRRVEELRPKSKSHQSISRLNRNE